MVVAGGVAAVVAAGVLKSTDCSLVLMQEHHAELVVIAGDGAWPGRGSAMRMLRLLEKRCFGLETFSLYPYPNQGMRLANRSRLLETV